MPTYSISLNISEEQRRRLIDAYREQIQSLRIEIRELEDLIGQLAGAGITAPQTQEVDGASRSKLATSEYKDNWGWALKVRYALAKAGRCLTTRDIIDELKKYESFDKDPINSVSGTLSSKVNKGVVFGKYRPYHAEYYFGLKEWFSDNGEVKAEFAAL